MSSRRSNSAEDDPLNFDESSPSRRRHVPPAAPPSATTWIGSWFVVFTAVLLANLLTAVILFLVVRAWMNHKLDELRKDLDRPPVKQPF